MFVEQSAARLWRVRLGFLLLCLVPVAGLAAWALHWHSVAHRQETAAVATRLLGTEVSFESLSHPQPGTLRLEGVRLAGTSLGTVEVEAIPTEVRLRLDRCDIQPGFVRQLATLANRWLTEPALFPRNSVIDITGLSWTTAAGEGEAVWPLRVECVTAGGVRAVRIVSPTRAANEIRIVRTVEPTATRSQNRWEVHATLTDPLPAAAIIAGLGRSPLAGWQLGPEAAVTGTLQAAATSDGWAGQASGRVAGVELGAVTAKLPYQARGAASIDVASLIWAESRVSAADLMLVSPRGTLAQEWLDGLVSMVGCRAAPATVAREPTAMREFEQLALRLEVDGGGARLRAEPQRAGCLVESQGLPLVFEPPAAVTLDRLAWLLSGTRAAAVPGTPVSAWLLSVLPLPQRSR